MKKKVAKSVIFFAHKNAKVRKDAIDIKNVTLGYMQCIIHSRHLLQTNESNGYYFEIYRQVFGWPNSHIYSVAKQW